MLERRSVLAGLAALPAAGLPLPALAGSRPDPFATYHERILTLQDAIDNGGGSDDEAERLMDRWREIDAQAMAGRPTTLAGALGALEYARRELHQFHVEVHEDVDGEVEQGDRLILHLVDGAIGVLRQFAGGGAA